MKKIQIVIVLFATLQYVSAQDYAGPDTTVCSGTPVMIGLPSTNPDYCYYWDAAEGMPESERYVAQPTVSPKHNTVYRVTVRGPKFKLIATDQVQIFIDFGPILKNPEYVNIGLTDSIQSKVELLKDGGRFYSWVSADEENTGCFINSFTGEISNCTTSGTFKFKAVALNDISCYIDDELEVNLGVKELLAIDAKNPNRIAKATDGQTLIVINSFESGGGFENRTINLKAIPNKGGIFGPGTPEWEGNLDGSPTSEAFYIGEMDNPQNTYMKVANDRTVYMKYEDASISTNTLVADPSFITNFLKYISGNRPGLINTSCPSQGSFLGYSLPGESISISTTVKKVEKFADPGIDDAYLYSYSNGNLGICGEISIPIYPPAAVPKLGFSVDLFIAVSASLGIVVDSYYDPSKATPYGGDVKLEGQIDLTAGIKVPVSAGVGGVQAAAFLSSGAKVITALNYPAVNSVVEVGGLSGTIQGTVWLGVESNNASVSFNKTIFPSASLGPYTLFTLQN